MPHPDVTLDEARLLIRLKPGRENATSLGDLAGDMRIEPRKIQAMVRHLRENGNLIGSRCDGEHGYFLIRPGDLADLDEGTKHIRSRALASLQIVSILEKAAAAQGFGDDPQLPRLFQLTPEVHIA